MGRRRALDAGGRVAGDEILLDRPVENAADGRQHTALVIYAPVLLVDPDLDVVGLERIDGGIRHTVLEPLEILDVPVVG